LGYQKIEGIMARLHERIIAVVIAGLFFLTSVGTGAFVLWQINQDNKQQKADTASANNNNSSNQKKEGKLKGTQLENFTPVDKVDSLQKIDLVTGNGPEVQPGATITAHYTGALAKTGVIFESSKDSGQPATFGLSQVIKGWQDGVPGMKVGGKRRLLIPADQAYGAQSPSADIPANSDLVFDIELAGIK
jgi:FKBP-type peptidyl-prolyl cis-trans isomerase